MKRPFLLLGISTLFALHLTAQDLKAEFADPSGQTITECDCKSVGDNALQVKIWLPQSTFLYDRVTFHFNTSPFGEIISSSEFSGTQLKAKSGGKDYVTIEVYPCGTYEKKDFTLSIDVMGSMITSYKEELKNNEIIKTPIYGNSDKIGSTGQITIHVDAATAKKKMGRMYILSAIVCGTLLILYLVNKHS